MIERKPFPRVRCRGYEGDLLSMEVIPGGDGPSLYTLVISPERDVEIKISCVFENEFEPV